MYLTTVHPRVCGERTTADMTDCAGFGSSPRVRGTLLLYHGCSRRDRFIPACAGNASHSLTPLHSSSVHPRVCGERSKSNRFTALGLGSSPRVRGTRLYGKLYYQNNRFIPACAGNANLSRGSYDRMAVHPRVCGERCWRLRRTLTTGGSSPRVRGTLFKAFERAAEKRFIPACAGNALSAACR